VRERERERERKRKKERENESECVETNISKEINMRDRENDIKTQRDFHR